MFCLNLPGRKYLAVILFSIDEEKDSMLYQNDSAVLNETTADVKQSEANDFLESRLEKKSDLTNDEVIQAKIDQIYISQICKFFF